MPAQPAPMPADEEARLAALRSYEVLDTPAEQEFDNLTRLAAQICGAPIALVTLVDASRQWFKARLGLESSETSRDIAFCAHAILGNELFEIGDTLEDGRFATNPLVSGEPGIRFYAGAPLRAASGHNLGTLCVIDRVPRQLQEGQREAMRILADEVMARLEMRRQVLEMRRTQESLRVLSRVIEASPTGVLIADARQPDLPLVYVNPAFEGITGHSAADVIGRNCRFLQGTDRDQPDLAPLREALTSAQPVTVTLRNYRKDGTPFWNELRLAPVTGPDGALSHFVGIQTDVTARKQMDEELRRSEAWLEDELARRSAQLRESEERFRLIAENSRDLIALYDEDGRYVYASPSHKAVLGYEIEKLLASDRAELVPAEDREHLRPLGEQTIPVEFRLLKADGTYVWMEGTSYWIKTGERRLVVAMGHDVTQRKRAEDELQQTQHFLQKIVDTIPGAVYVHDLESGRNVFVSREITSLLGYRAAEVQAIGSELIQQLLHPDDAPRILEAHRGYVTSEDDKSYEMEYRAKHASGEWRTLRSREVPFERVDGTVRQILGVAIDVTDQRRSELLLTQAQKVEAIGRLAGGVAHDFNNIFAVIMGYGQLAERQIGSEHPARPRLDQMLKAAERAAGLTRQLLAFSRKQVMQPKVLDLNVVVADTQKMLGRLIGEDIDFVTHVAPGLGTVKADPGQIEQVILNLAVNARDAMPKGGTLTLETANVDFDADYAAAHPPMKAGGYAMLAVSDTGIGMDTETQRRIFEPFFTTKPEGQGTGLGLATVYGIVKQSDGYILVESEPGRGTTFKMYLPRVDDLAEAVKPAVAAAVAPRGDETILLVEDTEALREVICEVLEEQGYTVLLSSQGEEALDLARGYKGPIHLLLTDVVMPKLGGGDLARQLAALRPEVRVLYMSGYAEGVISHQGVLGEGVALLEKPFTPDKLVRAVREALDRETTI
jgi:two-component system, cell cycle sensor histidine kinase and response regulator CckA